MQVSLLVIIFKGPQIIFIVCLFFYNLHKWVCHSFNILNGLHIIKFTKSALYMGGNDIYYDWFSHWIRLPQKISRNCLLICSTFNFKVRTSSFIWWYRKLCLLTLSYHRFSWPILWRWSNLTPSGSSISSLGNSWSPETIFQCLTASLRKLLKRELG